MIINTLHSTLFFECLTSNIPCFIFSNFSLENIKKNCKKDFINLKKYWCNTKQSVNFANFLNKKFKNIDEWWNDKKISNIKNKFVRDYCFYEKKSS